MDKIDKGAANGSEAEAGRADQVAEPGGGGPLAPTAPVRGLYLRSPHGRLIAEGVKSAVAKGRPRPDLEGGTWVLVSKEDGVGLAYGEVDLGAAAEVGAGEFDGFFKQHRVTRKERARWWPGADVLQVIPVAAFRPFGEPREVSVPAGVQTVMEEVAFKAAVGPAGASGRGGDDMPYRIKEEGDQFCVQNTDTDENVKGGCHGTRKEAVAHMRALYANVADAGKSLSETEKMDRIRNTWYAKHDPQLGLSVGEAKDGTAYITDVYAAFIIVKTDAGFLLYPYVTDADGAVVFGEPSEVEKEYVEKARGEGLGAGGERQGDGGVDSCVCPECGAVAEHERGTPCLETECPKCGETMKPLEPGAETEVAAAVTKADGEREKLHTARDARAEKYGIAPKEGGHLTPPKGYPEDAASYGDPVGYVYPLDTPAHILSARQYFNHDGMREKGGYTTGEWAIVGGRIAKAAGEGYSYGDGKVVAAEGKALDVLFAEGDLVVADTAEGPQAFRAVVEAGVLVLSDAEAAYKLLSDPGPFAALEVFEGPDGETWMRTWSTNAFKDREGEIFTTKALEEYAARHEDGGMGTYDFWHVKGSDFGSVRWQGVVGRFLLELGSFDDTPTGHSFKEFFKAHPGGHPEIAPNGWGTSPEFWYIQQDRKDGVFEWLEKRRTSVLPLTAAANVWNGSEVDSMALTDKMKSALVSILGDAAASRLIGAGEGRTKKLEEGDVGFKAAEEAAETDGETAEEEPAEEQETPAEEPATEEPGDGDPVVAKALTEELAGEIAERFQFVALSDALENYGEALKEVSDKADAGVGQLEAVAAVAEAVKDLGDRVDKLTADVEDLSRTDEERLARKAAEETPRYGAMSWMRPSQAQANTITKEHAEALGSKEAVATPSAVREIVAAMSGGVQA